jgi:hypothetical protein
MTNSTHIMTDVIQYNEYHHQVDLSLALNYYSFHKASWKVSQDSWLKA